MASRNEKRGASQTFEIPGMHPPLIFSLIVVPPAIILWLLRSPNAESIPSQHLAILGLFGLVGTAAAFTSRCRLTLKQKPSDGPLNFTKVWRILGIPVWRTQWELRAFTTATAAEQLDWIGFFFFFLLAIALTGFILIFGAVMLALLFMWVIAVPGLIVLRKLLIAFAIVTEGASEPGSFLDSVNPGKTRYGVRLMGQGKKPRTICRRLDSKQTSRVLSALRKASLELVKLPPEFA